MAAVSVKSHQSILPQFPVLVVRVLCVFNAIDLYAWLLYHVVANYSISVVCQAYKTASRARRAADQSGGASGEPG